MALSMPAEPVDLKMTSPRFDATWTEQKLEITWDDTLMPHTKALKHRGFTLIYVYGFAGVAAYFD